MNKKFYIIVLIISLLMMIIYAKANSDFISIVSGIGCSGFAAALMGMWLEFADDKRKRESLKKSKELFFRNLCKQMNDLIGRIIWFDKRFDDESFDWNLTPIEYLSFRYMKNADQQYEHESAISFEESIDRLNALSKKYSLDNYKQMDEIQKKKVIKMSQIIAENSRFILSEISDIEKNKLLLSSEGYMSLEEIDKLYKGIGIAIDLMLRGNYGVALLDYSGVAADIRKILNYNDNVRIGLYGTFL